MERGLKELLLPVFDPNRERLYPQELYGLILVIFSDNNIEVHLHKKNYLSLV